MHLYPVFLIQKHRHVTFSGCTNLQCQHFSWQQGCGSCTSQCSLVNPFVEPFFLQRFVVSQTFKLKLPSEPQKSLFYITQVELPTSSLKCPIKRRISFMFQRNHYLHLFSSFLQFVTHLYISKDIIWRSEDATGYQRAIFTLTLLLSGILGSLWSAESIWCPGQRPATALPHHLYHCQRIFLIYGLLIEMEALHLYAQMNVTTVNR